MGQTSVQTALWRKFGILRWWYTAINETKNPRISESDLCNKSMQYMHTAASFLRQLFDRMQNISLIPPPTKRNDVTWEQERPQS